MKTPKGLMTNGFLATIMDSYGASEDLEDYLRALGQMSDDLQVEITNTVEQMRAKRYSWAKIGDALFMTRQAAQQRFG